MKCTTFQEFQLHIELGYNVIPLMAEIKQEASLPVIFEHFTQLDRYSGLLESGKTGRYSYIPFHFLAKIEAKDGVIMVEQKGNLTQKQGDPLDEIEQFCLQWKAPSQQVGPDWQGGALAYFAYDMVQYFENLPNISKDDLTIPDCRWVWYRDVIVLDHKEGKTFFITNVMVDDGDQYTDGIERLNQWIGEVSALPKDRFVPLEHAKSDPLSIVPSFQQEEFEQAVIKVQDYIRSGDVFQVNLSVRQMFPIHSTSWELYQTLRKVNPSPYKAFLQYSDFQVVCGSPELLVKIQDGRVSTRPIAGTRPRGKDREEDLRLAGELLNNEKERAEHIMLVDLERNDLGRVCRYGSVSVTDLMVIEEYSHVMHIVSHVEGELATGKTRFDAIRSCFPGGTITGAPKIRTMEIIEELEPVKRGIYTGSIGWLGFNGDIELNIVIRTLLAKDGKGYVQAGAGIVIDSKPDAEYYESLKKAEALLRAVEISEANERQKMRRA